MSEELTETTPEETVETAEAAPALTDDAVAAYLGIPVEDVGKAKNVGTLYKRANDLMMQARNAEKSVAERAKEPAKQEKGDDPYAGLDPDQAQLLRKLIRHEAEQLVGPLVYEQRNVHQQEVVDIMSDFLAEHASDSDFNPADVDSALDDLGLREKYIESPRATPKQVKSALDKAYRYVKASKLDIEAEVEKRLAEKLAEAKEKGEEVLDVKPKRSTVKEAEASLDDPNLSVEQRASLVQRLLKQQKQ